MEPTLIVTGTSGAVKVVSKLYGKLTPVQADRAKKDAQHRAEQLNLDKLPKPREVVFLDEDDRDE